MSETWFSIKNSCKTVNGSEKFTEKGSNCPLGLLRVNKQVSRPLLATVFVTITL
jgi:hypothetical protein